jgi:DNA-binding MarR family transcriptional regulator
MAREYGVEKVNLLWVLDLVVALEGERSGLLVRHICETACCRERAAKDALSILRKAGYIVATTDESDRRSRQYVPTERGWQLFHDPYAGMLLRFARKLFTSCPSPAVRSWRQDEIERAGSAEARLEQAEQSLLNHALGLRGPILRLAG